jgi:hypothetical protein
VEGGSRSGERGMGGDGDGQIEVDSEGQEEGCGRKRGRWTGSGGRGDVIGEDLSVQDRRRTSTEPNERDLSQYKL